jgi:hypothetical protein
MGRAHISRRASAPIAEKESVLTQRGDLRESRPDKHARRDTARAFSFAAASIIAMGGTACIRSVRVHRMVITLNRKIKPYYF